MAPPEEKDGSAAPGDLGDSSSPATRSHFTAAPRRRRKTIRLLQVTLATRPPQQLVHSRAAPEEKDGSAAPGDLLPPAPGH
ncbi:unnamed protein product [Linum trigynum]|uniref:Uncharacterized protein n=1 Tax=Linum trigynum TaxID=586398 RepID=A0AAV2E304_9ROSI